MPAQQPENKQPHNYLGEPSTKQPASGGTARAPQKTQMEETDTQPTYTLDRRTAFLLKRPRFRWIGQLTPMNGQSRRTIRIDRDALTIGRDRAVCEVLADESVSRVHAQITRRGEEFVLEDLNSSNGTYVDSMPILSVVLHDGDMVQIGQNLFYFERLLEQVGAELGADR